MKNYSLLLLLFLFTFGYSQINPVSSDYVQCAYNTPTTAVFTLFYHNNTILGNLNELDYTISFYHNEADAQSNSNAITFTEASFYENTSNPETIYVRVTNNQTSAIDYSMFNLVVNENPVGNPAVLTFCDFNADPTFNLSDAIPQIIGNQQNVEVIFYDSLTSSNNLYAGTIYSFSQLPQVVGAELRNTISGCSSGERVPVTLDRCANPCQKPTAITATSITPYGATIGWTSPNAENNEVLVVLAGSPAPTANVTGGSYTVSNQYSIYFLLPGYCYDVYVRSRCSLESISDWAGPITFCTLGCSDNGNCPDYLELSAFLDSNSNGVKDAGEEAFINGSYLYEANNSGDLIPGYSNTGSFKIFDNNPSNFYDLNFTINQGLEPYFSATTSYSNINIPEGSGSQIFYFPVTQLQPYQDLEVQLIPNGVPPRPGFTCSNVIHYKNNGLETIAAGTINFVKDEHVSIISISQSGTVNTANGFSFDFTNLGANEERQINVEMQVPTIPTVFLGQVLTNSVSITPLAGDSFPVNNSYDLAQIVVGSYDPNEKSEKHGGKIAIDEFTTSDYLTYTIQFENTGTANAEFVRIEDVFDAQLDLSSVVMLSSSHPVNMRKMDNKLIWNFYNINLPPSLSDPLLSHGFVQFKAKPVSVVSVGTIIPNAAAIYFDYNPPIYTEVCETEFVETLSTNSFNANTIAIYPNPASTTVRIVESNSLEKIASINVYDIVGKEVIIFANRESSEVNLDVSRLNKGVYFVEITLENKLKFTKKLVIQ